MDIKDCKVGTRVVCINGERCNIPTGATGTIIENNNIIPFVSFDEDYGVGQKEVGEYSNCKVMKLSELGVLSENASKETNLGKLTVSLATEDVNSIAKDILKVVLQDIYNHIEALSKSLSKDLGDLESVVKKGQVFSERDVLDKLLYCIVNSVYNNDVDDALKLSEAYQRIKSVSTINTRSI